jgi:uncharacterized YigZ family protein
MSLKPYKTLLKAASDEFIVNKSRFIGYGQPCETEEEALEFLQTIRTKHKDATHNCYAYIIGPNMGVMRYSDDGEPGGTAGMPIIEVMKARGVTNCAVVVTRYFGGVLLGAGGLVRAYSQGAATALDSCGVGTIYPTSRYLLEVSYPMLNRLDYFLKDEPIILKEGSSAKGQLAALESLRGTLPPSAEKQLEAVDITVNKNTVPFETRSPFVTSGVRIGTAALTTRGMKEAEMHKVADWIVDVLTNTGNETRLAAIRSDVERFARQFPLFAW